MDMNKPVAWTEKDLKNACRNARLSEDNFFRIKAYLPVDTHPVKELTDEEITELENALKACDYKYFGSYAFTDEQWDAFEVLEKHAKAILRKAQEK